MNCENQLNRYVGEDKIGTKHTHHELQHQVPQQCHLHKSDTYREMTE